MSFPEEHPLVHIERKTVAHTLVQELKRLCIDAGLESTAYPLFQESQGLYLTRVLQRSHQARTIDGCLYRSLTRKMSVILCCHILPRSAYSNRLGVPF